MQILIRSNFEINLQIRNADRVPNAQNPFFTMGGKISDYELQNIGSEDYSR